MERRPGLLIWFLPAWLLLCLSAPAYGHTGAQALDQGWEYRWGDSPFTADGVPEWVLEDAPEQWHAIDFPSNPPGRDGRRHAWFRITLPEGEWQAPVLYIYSVDIIVQVWFRGQKLYQYGHFDAEGQGAFEGWPWHAIELPAGYENEPIYFRVYSNYTDIGLWGEVAILDKPDLILNILNTSMESLVIAGVSILIALISLVFAATQTDRRGFASIALFALASAVMLVAESQASLLIAYQPLMWDYLAAGSYYLIPVAMALLLEQWLRQPGSRLLNWIWKLHLVFLCGALGLPLAGWLDLSSTFPVFDGLFLVSLLLMGVVAIRHYRSLSREQQVILVAYGLYAGLLVADMAVAHGVVPWERIPVSWGALAFSVAVVSVSIRQYSRAHKDLAALNLSLERQVGRTHRPGRGAGVAGAGPCPPAAAGEPQGAQVGGCDLGPAGLQGRDSGSGCLGPVAAGAVPAHARGLLSPGCAGPVRAGQPLGRRRRGFPGHSGRGHAGALAHRIGVGGARARHRRRSVAPVVHCFWLNVESASAGSVTEGILLVQPEPGLETPQAVGLSQTLASLQQFLDKIGITLSGILLREDLARFSYEDALTGLRNRRYFDELFHHESAVAQRSGHALSLLMVDIDHFKSFNDTYGHEAGDQVLRLVASLLREQFRESDTVCRYGGEEFVVMMPRASLGEALDKAEALRGSIARVPVMDKGVDLGRITISVGVATWPESTEVFASLLRESDAALYRAKSEGRNRVVAAAVPEL